MDGFANGRRVQGMRANSNCSTSQFGVSDNNNGMMATQDVIHSPFNVHQVSQAQDDAQEVDEEMIEEEICQSQQESPLINAKTKAMNGGKAAALIPSQ